MIVEPFSVSFGSTGSQGISLNNITNVDGVIFMTGGKYGVNETANSRQGFGASDDGGYQFASGLLKNSSGNFTRNYPGIQSFAVLDGASGNPAVLGNVTGFSSGQIDVDIDNADSNFQIFGVAFGS